MDSIWHHLIWHNDKFLGVEWSVWKFVGYAGSVIFFSRFLVQWYATEKTKQVTVPMAFWWFSLIGALLLFAYSVHQHDSVFIISYAFSWIPYIRNIVIHKQHKAAHSDCVGCDQKIPPQSNYCPNCGVKVA
jgi:lipid-A-disaccharide synthase-like uncharacterized protein